MKILFISTPTRTYSQNYFPPFGLMHLCSFIRQNDHEVAIIDQAKERFEISELIQRIEAENPDIICVSGIVTSFRYVKELMLSLNKKFPNVIKIIGGHISLDIEDILLKDLGFNFVVNSYGEKKLLHLIDYLEGKKDIVDIPGIAYLKNNNCILNPGELFFSNVDDLPLPAYDLIDMEYYSTVTQKNPKLEKYLEKTGKSRPSEIRTFPVMGALGCTDKCSFCIHEFHFKGFRLHSVDYVIKNVRYLYDNYNIRVFLFGEDLFLFRTSYASEFVNEMNKNFPDAYFSCSIRSDYVNEEMLEILNNSNCFTVGFGFESANDYILNILYKRNSGKNNIYAYKAIRDKTKMTPACSFMVGAPGETEKTVDDTINAIKEAKIIDSAVFIANPYPGTRLYRWCIENKLIKDRIRFLYKISDHDAIKLSVNMTKYPNFIVKMMRIMVINQLENNKLRTISGFRINLLKRITNHIILPKIYRLYFRLSRVIHNENKDYGNIKMNQNRTVLLDGEKQYE